MTGAINFLLLIADLLKVVGLAIKTMTNQDKTRNAAIARRNYDKRSGKYPVENIAPTNIDPDQLEAYRSEYYHPTTRKVGAPATGVTRTPLNVNVSIDVLEEARKLGVNLSAACEDGLKMAINRMLIL